jgi:hypothetical protein
MLFLFNTRKGQLLSWTVKIWSTKNMETNKFQNKNFHNLDLSENTIRQSN